MLVYGTNAVLTKVHGKTRGSLVAVATTMFFVGLVALAWALRKLQRPEGDLVPVPAAPDAQWLWENEPCRAACPVHTDAGAYVTAIAEGRFEEAYLIARAPNPFPSVCGRVCAAPCERACRRGSVDAPVSIRALKRFVTERFGVESFAANTMWHAAHGEVPPGQRSERRRDRRRTRRSRRGMRPSARRSSGHRSTKRRIASAA